MLPNPVNFSSDELLAIFGENNCLNFPEYFENCAVCIDTRIQKKGDMFFALVGENQDAHCRIEEAFQKGAVLCVVNKSWFENNSDKYSNNCFVIVDNSLEALGKLANYHRRKFEFPIIAIAGANGKTTTKEMTSHLLSQKYKVLKTFENFNNQLGVPLMLFQINEHYDVAVLEIGTNEPGEIYKLTNIVEPTMGLITNIGKEHLEKLIDIDGVEMEETHLFGYLAKNDYLCFINEDDERLRKYKAVIPKYTNYGTDKNAKFSVEIALSDELNPILTFKTETANKKAFMKTIGYTSALNAIAASAIASEMDLSIDDIISGLESFENKIGHQYARMLLEKVNSVKIINDCYNANPESMKAGLNTLAKIKSDGKRISVLADMKELGQASETEHIEILNYAIEHSDLILTYGNEFANAIELLNQKFDNKLFHYSNQELLCDKLSQILHKGDTILVKGSRSMKMENIVEYIKRNINIL